MPPIYSKVNPADAPVLTLAITSPSLPVIRLNDLVENRLAPKLSQVNGVGSGGHCGRAPPGRCASRPTPPRWPTWASRWKTCAAAIAAANVKQAKGGFDGPRAPPPSTPTTSCSRRRNTRPDLRVQERQPRPPARRRRRRWTTPKTPAWPPGRARPDGLQVRRHTQHPPPARCQRDRHGRSHQGLAAPVAGHAACVAGRAGAYRPHHHRPRLGAKTCRSSWPWPSGLVVAVIFVFLRSACGHADPQLRRCRCR